MTGGAGFIGSHLSERLASLGNEVAIIDNLSTGKQNIDTLSSLGIKIYQSDITNLSEIEEYFKDVDIVFHLAAMNRAQRSILDPLLSNRINVTGTLNCLKLAKDNGIEKFVFSSSSSVYDGSVNQKLKEGMSLKPLHPYGVGKLAAEHYCRIFHEIFNLNTIILRYFSVYGPRQRGDIEHAGVIAKFIDLSLQGHELPITPRNTRSRRVCYR